MFDKATAVAIREGIGEPEFTASDQRDPSDAVQLVWEQWAETTGALQAFGISPASMCDGVNRVAEIRQEVGASEHAHS